MSKKKVVRKSHSTQSRSEMKRLKMQGAENVRTPLYWICDDCVRTKHSEWKSAYPNGGNTGIVGLCGHCERTDEATLTPTCDFIKLGQKFHVWD